MEMGYTDGRRDSAAAVGVMDMIVGSGVLLGSFFIQMARRA